MSVEAKPPVEPDPDGEGDRPDTETVWLALDEVVTDASLDFRLHTYTPRQVESLAESIRKNGLWQTPVVWVRPGDGKGASSSEVFPGTDGDVEYVLISGKRRLAALRLLGSNRERFVVVRGTREAARNRSIEENCNAETLSPAERVHACVVLRREGLKLSEIAAIVHVSDRRVRDYLKLEKNLHPDLYRSFLTDPTNTTSFRELRDLMARPMAEQLDAYRQLMELKRLEKVVASGYDDQNLPDGEPESPSNDNAGPKPRRRPSRTDLRRLLVFLEENEQESQRLAASDVLRYVLEGRELTLSTSAQNFLKQFGRRRRK